MGAFFTNLQLAVGADRLAEVRAALEADARADGMVPVADGEAPDRQVIVVPGARWTSIYDEAGESQDEAVLDRVGAALSRATGAAAFSVLIHDSDVLRLALYQGGKRTDRYDSNPGYFGGRRRRGDPERHVAAWRALARSDDDALRAVFSGGELFAEAALPVLARALGVDDERLDRGQKYLSDGSFGPLPAGAVVFGWRARERPAWDRPASGPPRLETPWAQAERIWGHPRPAGAHPTQQVAVGGEVRLGLTTLNAGGPGVGLRVELNGDDGIAWHTAQVVLGNPKDAKWLERPLTREGDRWVARFEDAKLPPGRLDPGLPTSGAAALKAMEARFATQVHVNLLGRAERTGELAVTVRLLPESGAGAAETLRVGVRSTEGRPLRAPADLHPTLLAPLLDRGRLVALVVLEPAALPRAAALVAAVAPALPTTGKVRTTRFPGPAKAPGALAGLMSALTAASTPKLSTGAAQGFLEGKRWRDLLASALGGSQVQAEWVQDPEAIGSAAELSIGAGLLPPPDALPVVALGVVADDGIEAALGGAIDALARDGAVIQAFVTRWGQTPSPDQTPYELACGVHGQCTTQRAWATRWLRGLGPGQLWLGRALAARLDPAGVSGEAVGDAVRIEVRDVAATERALAGLLPGPADWQAGVARRYGR